jgi:hypothetical protein
VGWESHARITSAISTISKHRVPIIDNINVSIEALLEVSPASTFQLGA